MLRCVRVYPLASRTAPPLRCYTATAATAPTATTSTHAQQHEQAAQRSGYARTVVSGDNSGVRLDNFVRDVLPGCSNGLIQRLLRKGTIYVRGEDDRPLRRLSHSHRLSPGQVVLIPKRYMNEAGHDSGGSEQQRVRARVSEEDAQELRDRVIFMDDDIIAVNKAPGLATQGGSKVKKHVDGLLPALCFDYDEVPRLVHRLDKDTSGVLVLARTREAARELSSRFRRHNLALKSYWGLCIGQVPEHVRVTNKLFAARTGGHEVMAAITPETDVHVHKQLAATTEVELVSTVGDDLSWATFRPVTGRKHQIRVHASQCLGSPLVGDYKYGPGVIDEISDIVGLRPKLHLHCRSLVLVDWTSDEFGRTSDLSITAPLPRHMRKAWKLLGFNHEVASVDAKFEGIVGMLKKGA